MTSFDKNLVQLVDVNYQIPRMLVAKRLISILLCLLILAIEIPNLGQIDLISHKVYYGWPDLLFSAIIITPLLLILLGINRSKKLERIGWVLMAILLVLTFSQ